MFIDHLNPSSASVGDNVTIVGSGFGGIYQPGVFASIGTVSVHTPSGVYTATIVSWDENEIVFTVPDLGGHTADYIEVTPANPQLYPFVAS